MRHNAYVPNHFHESLSFVLLALALYAAALIGARRLLGERVGERLALAGCAAAALVFALSVFYAAGRDDDKIAVRKAALADFSAIREIASGKRVMPAADLWGRNHDIMSQLGILYYLSGSLIQRESEGAADYVVSRYRDESFDLFTPDNRFIFLYGPTDLTELLQAELRSLKSREPAARGAFDVYLDGKVLRYLKAPCGASDRERLFFLHIHPANAGGAGGFRDEAFDFFKFDYGGKTVDDACIAIKYLPGYPIAAVATGQWDPGIERFWDVFIAPPLDDEARAFYESAYQAITSSGAPAARSGFDLYLDRSQNTLSYLKAPFDEEDTRGRFFLSVHPANAADLPADRREIGHESLNFTFAPPAGAIFANKCMAIRLLPDYEIARIETGQWIPGGDELWGAEIVVGD